MQLKLSLIFQASNVRTLDRAGPSSTTFSTRYLGPSVPARVVPLHLLTPAHPGQLHGGSSGVWSSPVRPGHVWSQ
jgi:hypothetical protein